MVVKCPVGICPTITECLAYRKKKLGIVSGEQEVSQHIIVGVLELQPNMAANLLI